MQRLAGGAGIGNKRPPFPGAGGTSKIANIAGAASRRHHPQAVHFWSVSLAIA